MNLLWLALFGSLAAAAPPEMEKVLGKKRVVVVMGEEKTPAFKKQIEALKKGATSLKERDVVVFSEGKVDGPIHRNYAQGKGFVVILFGKDREEKMRAVQPVEVATITGLVDAMPMRKKEVEQGR